MNEQPVAYPGYATPIYLRRPLLSDWLVRIKPGLQVVGSVKDNGAVGWTATSELGMYVGLFPDKQAAGEALVKHAGYEVLG